MVNYLYRINKFISPCIIKYNFLLQIFLAINDTDLDSGMGEGKPLDATDFANGNNIDMSISDGKDPINDVLDSENDLFEGDIDLNNEQEAMIQDEGNADFISLRAASTKRKWAKIGNIVPIPYLLSSSYSSSERATIARAFTEFETKTCIRFENYLNCT